MRNVVVAVVIGLIRRAGRRGRLRHPRHRSAPHGDGRGDRPSRRRRRRSITTPPGCCSSTAGTSISRPGLAIDPQQVPAPLVGPERPLPRRDTRCRRLLRADQAEPRAGRHPDARADRRAHSRQARDGRGGLRRQRPGRRLSRRRGHALSPDRRLRDRATGGLAASYQLLPTLAIGGSAGVLERAHPRPPRRVPDRQRHRHQQAHRHEPRARARRQRAGRRRGCSPRSAGRTRVSPGAPPSRAASTRRCPAP